VVILGIACIGLIMMKPGNVIVIDSAYESPAKVLDQYLLDPSFSIM
jgi:hypothetical protein